MHKTLLFAVMIAFAGCPNATSQEESTSSSSTSSSSTSSSSSSSSGGLASSSTSVLASSAEASSAAPASSAVSSSTGGVPGWPTCGAPTCAWPAEAAAGAEDLSLVEGPQPNDFGEDLSGASWNAQTGTLWLSRNGGTGGSKVWALEKNGGTWQVAMRNGQRAEWTGFGDAESLMQVPAAGSHHVWVLDEAVGVITEYDMTTGGTATVSGRWDLSADLPAYTGGNGPEGMEFIPNAALAAGGFMDPRGGVAQGVGGTGGLVVLGHQQAGRLYFFDLAYPGSTATFIGAFSTGGTETAALEFDEATGTLLAWHGDDVNDLEVMQLAWTAQGSERVMRTVVTYDLPGTDNYEGIALQDVSRCMDGMRTLFATIDDGAATSLLGFTRFPCP